MKNSQISSNPQAGFTFLEVIIASFISAILVAGAALLWYYFTSSYSFSFELSQALELAQSNVNTMIRELREAQIGESGEYPLATAYDDEIVFHGDVDNDGLVERVRYYLVGTTLTKQVFNVTPGTKTFACLDKCNVCHDGNMISIDEHAWPSHYAHGDKLGACPQEGEESESAGSEPLAFERIVADYVSNGTTPIFTYYNGDYPGDSTNNPLIPSERLLETRVVSVMLSINPSSGPVGAQAVSIENLVHLRNLKDNL
jgi:prepilin-type N-terminal cleavage/methylation domain-containing protein